MSSSFIISEPGKFCLQYTLQYLLSRERVLAGTKQRMSTFSFGNYSEDFVESPGAQDITDIVIEDSQTVTFTELLYLPRGFFKGFYNIRPYSPLSCIK
jgi:hypothetical protein